MSKSLPNEIASLSELPLKIVFEQSGLGMMVVDSDGVIVESNAAFRGILGYDRERVEGAALAELIHQDDAPGFLKLFEKLRGAEIGHLLLDCRFICNEKRMHWLHLSMTRIAVSAAASYVLGMVEDVTRVKEMQADLKRSKESAEESTKIKSEFLANMSHEIRTPIHTIIGMQELLEETSLDDEQKEYSSQIGFAADVLLNLVNNILDFSKIEAGKLNLDIIDFNISAMIEETVDLVSLEAHRKGIEMVTWVGPSLPADFRGDPHRIRQIITNLIKNAVKFTESGEILLTVKPIEEVNGRVVVRFAVKDTGIGIPEDKKDRLFQSFSQVDSSTTRRFGGTGLGLTISKNLTRIMNGRIGLKSKAGQGSTFWFSLPLAPAGNRGDTAGGPAPELRGIRVLIVDDNVTVQKALHSYLSYWNCRAEYAENGRVALQKLKDAVDTDRRFDVALVDAQLPGIDGWQLASEISSDKTINYLKLVLLTPTGKSGDEAKMKLLHWFDAYLNKPVRLTQLREALSRITSQAIDLEAVEVDEIPKEPLAKAKLEKPFRILLAEDHVVNQELFRTILEKLGYSISVAADGMEAVALATENTFDLIFMDVQMPRMNGLEAARALRSQNCRAPIVAVTANATKEEMQRCLEAGMNDFIGKPFKKKDLLPVLERWTRRDDDPEGTPGLEGGPSRQAQPGREAQREREAPPEREAETEPAAASERAAGSPEIFDFEAAVETFLGDEEAVRSVLEAFAEKLTTDVDQLKAAHEKADTDALSKVAHSIKGGALNLEAKRLGAAAAALEQAAKAGPGPAAEQSYEGLLAAYREFAEHVESRFG